MPTITIRLLVVFVFLFYQSTHAQASLFSHSVESIIHALQSPIPSEVLLETQAFDNHLVRTGAIHGKRIRLIHDDRLTRTTHITQRLLRSIGVNPYNWVVRVLDTQPKIENAFVVGGPYVYVYTGLIDSTGSDDELAFIIAHEIAHVLLKHQVREKEDITNLVATLIELRAVLSKNEDRRDRYNLLGGALKANYSRADEQEADALAVVIASKAGYNAFRGIEFFARHLHEKLLHAHQRQAEQNRIQHHIWSQIDRCNSLRLQWETNPRVRTPANARYVNNVCHAAYAHTERYNNYIFQQSTEEARSELLRTHPHDQERINNLSAIHKYVNGQRTLDSLSGIGQGYYVLLALQLMHKQSTMIPDPSFTGHKPAKKAFKRKDTKIIE